MSAAVVNSESNYPEPGRTPALYLAEVPAQTPRKRGRPRKGTLLEGPVPVVEPKEQVLSSYQRACQKVKAAARAQHTAVLSHHEAQSLLYGIRRLAEIAENCPGTTVIVVDRGKDC